MDSEVPFYRKRLCGFASGAEDSPVEDCCSLPILTDSSGVYTPLSIASTLHYTLSPSTLSTPIAAFVLRSLISGYDYLSIII